MKRPLVFFSGVAATAIACAVVGWLHFAPIAHETAELASFDHRDGKKEAEADIARGIVKWKVAGRVSDYGTRAALLKETLKTELDWFGDCTGSEGRTRYVAAYNAAVRGYLVTVYGEAAVFGVLGQAPVFVAEAVQNG
jgi:hypothetical protein